MPAIGSDFDELALGIGEIEEDLFGSGGGAAGIDAVGDANAAGMGIAGGLGVEVTEDGDETPRWAMRRKASKPEGARGLWVGYASPISGIAQG